MSMKRDSTVLFLLILLLIMKIGIRFPANGFSFVFILLEDMRYFFICIYFIVPQKIIFGNIRKYKDIKEVGNQRSK